MSWVLPSEPSNPSQITPAQGDHVKYGSYENTHKICEQYVLHIISGAMTGNSIPWSTIDAEKLMKQLTWGTAATPTAVCFPCTLSIWRLNEASRRKWSKPRGRVVDWLLWRWFNKPRQTSVEPGTWSFPQLNNQTHSDQYNIIFPAEYHCRTDMYYSW